MSPKIFDKICSICGDKASGFHFDAITCESCKSFFRRNALKKQSLRCFLGEKCKIDVFNRTFCKRCRLKKCFDCGMKTDFILTEEQKLLRKTIIEENRKRKRNSDSDEKNPRNGHNSETSLPTNQSENISFDFLEDFVDTEDNGVNCDSINDESNTNEDNVNDMALIAIERAITDPKYIFNELEGNRLTELLNAMQFMSNPSVPFGHAVVDFWEAVNILYHKLDVDIRKLVKMTKNLSGFITIDKNDQFTLVKSASIEIIVIRLILEFDFQFEYWNVATNNQNSNLIKLDLLNNNTRPRNTYPDHKHFLQSIGPEWDSDPVIIDLLSAIILFNPDYPQIVYKDAIRLQQKIYLYLLKRYLQIKYRCEEESESKFLRLINSLSHLESLERKIRVNCLSLEYPDIPLLKEICNP